jgi:hypothetical protein
MSFVIKIACFRRSDTQGRDVFVDGVDSAQDMGRKVGFQVEVLPANFRDAAFVLPFRGPVNSKGDAVTLYQQACFARLADPRPCR